MSAARRRASCSRLGLRKRAPFPLNGRRQSAERSWLATLHATFERSLSLAPVIAASIGQRILEPRVHFRLAMNDTERAAARLSLRTTALLVAAVVVCRLVAISSF